MTGFLGTRAPLIPDLVVSALAVVLPLFTVAIVLAKRKYRRLHALIQQVTFAVLFVVVVAFVIWARFFSEHVPELEASSLYRTVYLPLVVGHVAIAVSALAVGTKTVLSARRKAKDLPGEGYRIVESYRTRHKVEGTVTLGLLVLTTASGIAIYYLRYVYVY